MPRKAGMTSHQTPGGGKEHWITPQHVLEALGPFGLDPCACNPQPWPTALRMIAPPDDGLAADWGRNDFVWLNPPYGDSAAQWLAKLKDHPGGGIALVFARTETAMFHDHVWGCAEALFFLRGRLTFHYPTGERARHNGGAPSVLIGYTLRAQHRLTANGLPGHLLRLERRVRR